MVEVSSDSEDETQERTAAETNTATASKKRKSRAFTDKNYQQYTECFEVVFGDEGDPVKHMKTG
jgi:hypothetical protein